MKSKKVVEHNEVVINPEIECGVMYVVTGGPRNDSKFSVSVGRVFVKFSGLNGKIQYLDKSMGHDTESVLRGYTYERFNGVLELSND
jgi:hypothetical protein